MAIGSAIERGSLICVYDEHGSTLFQKARGSGATDGLLGFTGSTVTARLRFRFSVIAGFTADSRRHRQAELRSLLDDFPLMEKRLLEVASDELVAAQDEASAAHRGRRDRS